MSEERKSRPWLLLAVIASLITVIVVAGAATLAGDDDQPAASETIPTEESETTEGSMDMDATRELAVDALVEVFAALTDSGLRPGFANYGYLTCDRDTPTWLVESFGRLDHPDGRVSTRDDAIHARDLLVELGWTPAEGPRWTEGLSVVPDNLEVAAEKGELSIGVQFTDQAPHVVMRVLGPCISVSDADEERFESTPPISLDDMVGATGGTFDDSPSTTEP